MVLRPEAIARALIIHGLDDYRQQCACGTFEEVIAEAIGQPGGFQVFSTMIAAHCLAIWGI